MKLTKFCLYQFVEDGDGETGPHISEWLHDMYDTQEEANQALLDLKDGTTGSYIREEQIDADDYAAYKEEQEYIARTMAEDSVRGIDPQQPNQDKEATGMAYITPESTMELIAHLYSMMDEDDKEAWSMDEAQKMVDDQYRYEISEGITPPYYSTTDFYEVIAELIRQDAEDAE